MDIQHRLLKCAALSHVFTAYLWSGGDAFFSAATVLDCNLWCPPTPLPPTTHRKRQLGGMCFPDCQPLPAHRASAEWKDSGYGIAARGSGRLCYTEITQPLRTPNTHEGACAQAYRHRHTVKDTHIGTHTSNIAIIVGTHHSLLWV